MATACLRRTLFDNTDVILGSVFYEFVGETSPLCIFAMISFSQTQLYYVNKFKRTKLHVSAFLKPSLGFDLKELRNDAELLSSKR